jgi:plasmid stabilization system protein ParE
VGPAASAPVTLTLSPRAIREAARYERWWAEHRPAARQLFEEELRHALAQIRSAPNLGTIFQSTKTGREYRRVLMLGTGYHVYYRVVDDEHVRVVAVWSAVRGRSPRL